MPAKPPRFFFNAHCHLELSHLRGAIPSGTPFVEWLGQVVRLKRQSIPELVQAGIALALNEMRATGTRALIDIDSMRASSEILRAFPIAAIACTEVIEFHAERAADAVRAAREYQDEVGPMGTGKHFGLSPHAPYTTTEPLLRAARAETGGRNEWLCIHAAETPEEVEMMLHGRGPLYDFLRAARVLPEGWRAPGMRPVEYLAHCGALGPRTLLVHLNEVTDDEIKLIAESGARAVVCPGTHIYFKRGEFPLARLLRAGVPVYLGTDSLASNETLNMAREVDIAVELSPGVEPELIYHIADYKRATDFGLQPLSPS